MSVTRYHLIATGQVQGVGFRPTVYKLALESGLTGFVRNSSEGVIIEVQGAEKTAASFAKRLQNTLPPLARLTSLSAKPIPARPGEETFQILHSIAAQGHQVLISPDTATCPDCLQELLDPGDRRYRYPFINCTNCGPRLTITNGIPYDRPLTSMACFPQCPECLREYENPLDRRFHAQPNCCPVCGPEVWLATCQGERVSRGNEALEAAALALAEGRILAVKGLGGFHLVCAAGSDQAVALLRQRKQRWAKPLAVMAPDLDIARNVALIGTADQELLESAQRPIVLLPAREGAGLSGLLAPDTDLLGLMLPYTPLHHVLLEAFRRAVGSKWPPVLVMTSGNLSSEPIALGNREALNRLAPLADLFVFHNRDILIRCDDSVVRPNPGSGHPDFFRRSRGYTPSPIFLRRSGPCVAGLGPELKTTVCLTKADQAFVSQHIGDLKNLETFSFYRDTLSYMQRILQVRPVAHVCDLHPDYLSTVHAREQDLPLLQVQHHVAHIHAVLAENRHALPALGLALDGAGLGEDRTIWGGEALMVDPTTARHDRLGHLVPVFQPGGEAAAREPWRMARSYLWSIGVTEPDRRPWPWLEEQARADDFVLTMLRKGLNCPQTTSCGRLFDAVAGLLGLKNVMAYEGQAAIILERVQDLGESHAPYPCPLRTDADPVQLDTLTLFEQVHADWQNGLPTATISRRFHLGLIHGLADLALFLAERAGLHAVGLSGGVMQNATMSTLLPAELTKRSLTPLTHVHLPPNDACISLGQAAYGRIILEHS